jgi:hypothetical protein
MRNAVLSIALASLVFLYYLTLGMTFQNNGYLHPEGIFLIEKALLALKGNPPRLENIGLIYPPLPFFFTFPFIISVNPIIAPVFASAFGMAVLCAVLMYRVLKRNLSFVFVFYLLMILTTNPLVLYSATSGGSSYLYVLFITIFFAFIFEYYERNVSFYLAVAGISLGILALIRYEIVFILVFWTLANFILAVETTLEPGVSYKNFYRLLRELPAYRQTFFRRVMAVYLMIFIPPIVSAVSWMYLNWIFTSNPFHFLSSPYSYFRTLRTFVLYNPILLEVRDNFFKSLIYILMEVFISAPTFLIIFLLFGHRLFFILALTSPVISLFISSFLGISLLNVDFFVPFVFLSFLVLVYACEQKKTLRKAIILPLFGIVLMISSFTGYYKLKNSNYPEEKIFARILLGGNADGIFEDEKKVAEFLKMYADSNDVILFDDADGYPIVVFYGYPKNIVLPYQYEFSSVVERPEVYADFIVVYNPDTYEGGRDALNLRHKDLFYRGADGLDFVASFGNLRIFRSSYRAKSKIAGR